MCSLHLSLTCYWPLCVSLPASISFATQSSEPPLRSSWSCWCILALSSTPTLTSRPSLLALVPRPKTTMWPIATQQEKHGGKLAGGRGHVFNRLAGRDRATFCVSARQLDFRSGTHQRTVAPTRQLLLQTRVGYRPRADSAKGDAQRQLILCRVACCCTWWHEQGVVGSSDTSSSAPPLLPSSLFCSTVTFGSSIAQRGLTAMLIWSSRLPPSPEQARRHRPPRPARSPRCRASEVDGWAGAVDAAENMLELAVDVVHISTLNSGDATARLCECETTTAQAQPAI